MYIPLVSYILIGTISSCLRLILVIDLRDQIFADAIISWLMFRHLSLSCFYDNSNWIDDMDYTNTEVIEILRYLLKLFAIINSVYWHELRTLAVIWRAKLPRYKTNVASLPRLEKLSHVVSVELDKFHTQLLMHVANERSTKRPHWLTERLIR